MTSPCKSIAQKVKDILLHRIGSGELRPGNRIVAAAKKRDFVACREQNRVFPRSIVEALDRRDGKKAGALLASHSNQLVRYLQTRWRMKRRKTDWSCSGETMRIVRERESDPSRLQHTRMVGHGEQKKGGGWTSIFGQAVVVNFGSESLDDPRGFVVPGSSFHPFVVAIGEREAKEILP